MAGWHISVFRLVDGGSSPAQRDSPKSTEIADWRAEFNGLRWIDDLVKAEGAVDPGGNGYPSWYTAQAKHLLQRIIDGPPYTIKDYDTTTHKWVWPRVINHTVAASCRPDEWLLVEVWDGS